MGISLSTEPQTRAAEMKHQKAKERLCAFPECTETFFAKGKQKYCDEHRKAEYRSKLYGKTPGETPVFDIHGNYIQADQLNLLIKHTYIEARTVELSCSCCDAPYEVTMVPRQYVYPKYCPEHRNEFKRNNYERTRGSDEEIDTPYIPVGESPCRIDDCVLCD